MDAYSKSSADGSLDSAVDMIKRGEMPPIGIEPKYIWEMKRVRALKSAIIRHLESNLHVSQDWIDEYNNLIPKENKGDK